VLGVTLFFMMASFFAGFCHGGILNVLV
jgi:hypothetical protein